MEEKKNLEEMNYKKLNDDYLDKITGGIAPGPPVPWICPYCARIVMIKGKSEVESHSNRCSEWPDGVNIDDLPGIPHS